MSKIKILGLGPGHKKYILPIVQEEIKNSEIIIGGKRNIESISDLLDNQKVFYINSKLDDLIKFIKENRKRKLGIIVSGDPGYYSLLNFMKKNFQEGELEVIPGISSMQYMFSKIGESWFDAYISSVHGRESDFLNKLQDYDKVGLLTDKKNTPQVIASKILEAGYKDYLIYVGENLSYDNESINKYSLYELTNSNRDFEMNVVIIKKNIGEK